MINSSTNTSLVNVAVIGAGGLGTPAAWSLAERWHYPPKLKISIIDHDTIERSNLNRQILFDESSIGLSKAQVLCKKLIGKYPQVSFVAVQQKLNQENIASLLNETDYVIDATDSVKTKFLINDFCRKKEIPYCYGGVAGVTGQLLAVSSEPESVDLREMFGDFTEEDYAHQTTTCKHEGIFGPIAGYIGVLQAEQAVNYLTNCDTQLNSTFKKFTITDIKNAENIPKITKTSPSNKKLNLRNKKCPMTFVFTKLALEKLKEGESIEVYFDNQESSLNVEKSCLDEGYTIITPSIKIANETWSLEVGKHAK